MAAVPPFLATLIGNLGHAGGDPPAAAAADEQQMQVVVEEARCECGGTSEECTPAYADAVRRRFSGRWLCGLCAAAVTEEAGKKNGETEAAAHMAVCRRFNGFGRTHPPLFHADAMRHILRKLSVAGGGSPKPTSSRRRELMTVEGAVKATGGVAGGMVIT
uniref:DUF1677 family protein n=1 Tax=Leersia perrieri TaxID=77586 RepID=A0A0D9VE20_9ORYZ